MSRVLVVVVLAFAVLGARAQPSAAAGGEVIVVFEQQAREGEHVGDIDIAAMRVSPSGELVWGEASKAAEVASAETLETNPHAIPDGAGGAIVVFEYEPRTGENAGDTEIAAQRVDASGKRMWEDGERSVLVAASKWAEKNPALVSDGQGGAIVVFEEHSRSGEFTGDVDIGAQRISASGAVLWCEDKRAASVASNELLERNPAAISDGAGGAIVVFEAEARTGEHAGDTEIYAQRIDAQGKKVWNDGGKSVIVASSVWAERNPVVIPDGQGGAIVIFERYARSGGYTGDVDIAAQRLSPSGELLWNGGESSVEIASTSDIERAPHAIPDGLGGAIIVFETEPRTGEHAGDPQVAGQRIDGSGKAKWEGEQGYALIANSEWAEKEPVAVPDGQGGAIVVFEQHARGGEYTGDIDIGAQRVSPTGKLLWEEGESSVTVSSSAMLERNFVVLPNGSGGVFVAFEMESRTGDYSGDADIGAQVINSAGKALWNEGERSTFVSSSKWSEKRPVVVGR
jgi:hypothetical protein